MNSGGKMKAAGGIVSMEDAELADGIDGRKETTGAELSEKMIEMLIKTAKEQLAFSYSPYSGFKVGAALLTENGKIYTGCNIENAAFSPTNCAERTAFFKAVSEGERVFRAICIVGGKVGEINCEADSNGGDGVFDEKKGGAATVQYAPPCGVCRQVMAEFCNPEKFQVILAAGEEEYQIFRLKELLPFGFGAERL